jgi:glycerol uptake operon antiterminator
MEGLGKDEVALRFIADTVGCDGIISTKPSVIKMASALGLKTVFRIFLIDSQSVESAFSTLTKLKPDAVEIMPGVMSEVIRRFSAKVPNLIAGGMVQEKRHVIDGIMSGAMAVSTSNQELWKLEY